MMLSIYIIYIYIYILHIAESDACEKQIWGIYTWEHGRICDTIVQVLGIKVMKYV